MVEYGKKKKTIFIIVHSVSTDRKGTYLSQLLWYFDAHFFEHYFLKGGQKYNKKKNYKKNQTSCKDDEFYKDENSNNVLLMLLQLTDEWPNIFGFLGRIKC